MKLRNKKTGEIAEFRYLQSDYVAPLVLTTYENDKPEMYSYNSLTELNDAWEDYEEPKEYWYIDADGEVLCEPSDNRCEFDNNCREIGNYFETEEEAEKAVEKLKVLKRLKDKDCEIVGYRFSPLPEEFLDGKHIWCNTTGRFTIEVNYPLDKSDTIRNNLDLLFGGEE